MFVIHRSDPPEYFAIMDNIQKRMIAVDGKYWVNSAWSDKFNDYYYEYHFECESMDDIVGELHFEGVYDKN